MMPLEIKFWSKILNNYVIPSDHIFVGALKDPKMIGLPYTGFKDSHGQKIFLGDIVTDFSVHPDDQRYEPISFEYGAFLLGDDYLVDYAHHIKKGKNKYASPTNQLEAEWVVEGNVFQDRFNLLDEWQIKKVEKEFKL